MTIFNYYKFNNVESMNDAMQNIKECAEDNGWTIDYFSTTSRELYLHSSGYGNQSLYYSMYWYQNNWEGLNDDSNLWDLLIFGNTGYNSSQPYYNQPGVWTIVSISNLNYMVAGLPITIPIITQYIFVTDKAILCFFDSNYTAYCNFTNFPNFRMQGRFVVHLYLGSLDLYNPTRTDGNVLSHFSVNRGTTEIGSAVAMSGLFGGMTYYSPNRSFQVLFENEAKNTDNAKVSISCAMIVCSNANSSNPQFVFRTGYDHIDYYDYYRTNTAAFGLQYVSAVDYNPFTKKATIIKPIVSVKHVVGGYNYYIPIGETPYYAAPHYPNFVVGQEVTFGQRKFVMFPLLRYTESHGVAVEVVNE